MSKPMRLPERPKPPQFSQITEDIEKASDDDVVFNDGNKRIKNLGSLVSASVTMEESFLDLSPSDDKDNTNSLNESKTEINSKNYEQALEFIELHKKLQAGPAILQEQYEQLEILGKDVSNSIDQLKESAEKFMKNKKYLI